MPTGFVSRKRHWLERIYEEARANKALVESSANGAIFSRLRNEANEE